MRRRVGCRAVLGMLVAVALIVLISPRSFPRVDPLDPAARAAEVTEFGLRTMVTLLAAYLAVVFLGVFLTAVRWLPSSIRTSVDRWTTRGFAGGLRRCVGLSALAIGILPLQPLAAHAAESAPVLAPDATAPPPSAVPRLVPTRPEPRAPEPGTTEPPTAAPEPADPEPPAPGPATPGPAAPRPAVRQVTVGPGDSFWTVAERLTSARLGRPAGDAEVLEPWLVLIAANRDRLTDPDDPDLLFPGQVLRLPD